ncbi:MAG: orotidine-5'-phosphate decarboxylase [Acidimicrobiaceae bacterium]|nr:orotidine-5'-phosphate decarboxylase [Acidimicrobiaceae bacterium]MBA4810880.1 orotidine-5'-phosphate decarboxylase [Acidimicrobiales bacterium]OUU99833.1 MAG: orotidine-5'-phosphate decarboxylase [Acidimicrobiaceae bacterium TMED77]|tara:strand:+ start:8169 stop:8891 length:723 start_codon:yes stop_codon:yes gene_type:complete
MLEEAEIKPEITNKLAVALDVDDTVAAIRLAKELQPYFGVAKVGLELFSAAGPDILGTLSDLGYKIFLDLKLHDIPNTVESAARVLGSLGIDYLTLHTAGGKEMVSAGVQGLNEGATNAGLEAPIALGVTILTSQKETPKEIMKERFSIAKESGCRGIVCSALNLSEALVEIPELLYVVPGIRPAGVEAHDQANVATPLGALEQGADLLVIGRAVTKASDPRRAAREILMEISQITPKNN